MQTSQGKSNPLAGAGLGLRRGLLKALAALPDGALEAAVDFMEVAPENWIDVGGRLGKALRSYSERLPLVCHGLSLSLGGQAPLDETFLRRVKRFLEQHHVLIYSEHLSYCSDDGQLYDLMPIPFTAEAIRHVAARIRKVQDILERRIAIENVSYYAAPGAEIPEIEFINAVLEEADCDLLLDVNNIHVNSINHAYDPLAFLEALPPGRVVYGHIAGHLVEAPDLRIDTHGAAVIPDVWDLLNRAYARFGAYPTLLERDFNFPPLAELFAETASIRQRQQAHLPQAHPARPVAEKARLHA